MSAVDPVQAVTEALERAIDRASGDPTTFLVEIAEAAVAAARPAIEREAKAEAWDEGFTRGFYDVLAGGDRDASESAAENPYRIEREASHE